MPTVKAIIHHMFPYGTRGLSGRGRKKTPDRTRFPIWPPDAFAVCATLVEMSGCYTHLGRPGSAFEQVSRTEFRDELQRLGAAWRYLVWAQEPEDVDFIHDKLILNKKEEDIQEIWDAIYQYEGYISSDRCGDWAISALKLMIIADEACQGIGFDTAPGGFETWITYRYQLKNIGRPDPAARLKVEKDLFQRSALVSACEFVPPEIACVQPKTRTPRVGCALRSLSFNLALLPPKGQVEVRWNQFEVPDTDSFNLVLIPYPYRISGRCFSPANSSTHGPEKEYPWGLFDVKQLWLPPEKAGDGNDTAGGVTGEPAPERAISTVSDLINSILAAAEKEVGFVDGVVLPELALNETVRENIENELRSRPYRTNGFFISGVWLEEKKRNSAFTTVYIDKKLLGASGDSNDRAAIYHSLQRKHHRWKLDRNQIVQYSLADALSPNVSWWENIDVSDRNLNFFVFRSGACFATLVCEDLARIDPCQTVLRSIGPNLVIALLMDGPQLQFRWPGRYAMGLADDPGCSVLTLTSLGMIRRSNQMFGGHRQVIGLWRDPYGETRELELPAGHHALVLSLSGEWKEEHTLDGRSDGETAYYIKLGGVMPISIGRSPEWLGL